MIGRRCLCLLSLGSLLVAVAPGAWAQAPTTRASVSTEGVEGNRASDEPSVSHDGRFVAFSSLASNLVSGDSNDVADVFVHDRLTRQTTRVSVGLGGVQGNGRSLWPSISADGRYVAFYSEATNLVSADTNGAGDVFVHDRSTGQTSRVSEATGARQAGGAAPDFPSISADGTYVAFWSHAANLVAGDTNNVADVFLHDRVTRETTRVSADSFGRQADDTSFRASVSPDGTHVAFLSYARNLSPGGDGGLTPDVFVYDRRTRQHSRIGLPFESRIGSVITEIGPSAISADGRFVAFNSTFPAGPPPGNEPVALSVFLHDRVTGQTSIVATRTLTTADPAFGRASISGSGDVLAFAAVDAPGCTAPGSPGTTSCPRRMFLHDRLTGVSSRADVPAGGLEDSGSASAASLSRDGGFLAFASDSSVLLSGQADGNRARDVFVRDTRPDTDGDGMPDAIETQFGLNPLVNDASEDPDGDGRTNLQEILAGTHPRGFFTRYLAEGATSSFFDTSIALVNPSDTVPASVLLRFLTGTGATASRAMTIPPLGRRTVDAKTVPGLAVAEFSTVIESDQLVVVDRTMRWDRSGYGSHAERAITSPALTWYFAEGATHSGFELFYLVQNPDANRPATVEVTYLRPEGAPALVKTYTIAPSTRSNIHVNHEARTDPALAGLGNIAVSAVVRSTNDVPVIVERAMYLQGAQTFASGHESAGVTAPALRWFLAEGATGSYFDLFVLIANPGPQAAEILVTYLLASGETLTKTKSVPALSRMNIWVNHERFPDDEGAPLLADVAVSTRVESTNGVPIIVERAMWWPGPTPATWQEAHNSPGSTETGTRWALAEGEAGGLASTETYILIANTSPRQGAVRVTLLFEDGTRAARTFQEPGQLRANSRFTVNVAAEFPAAVGRRFGALIESIGTMPVEIVVERAMYSNANDVEWAAGTNALATRLP